MKNNGFTLMEVLGVIIILTIIFLLVVPTVNKIIDRSRQTAHDSQINTLLEATYNWSLKNLSKLPSEDEKVFVTLGELKKGGFIDPKFVDPSTQNQFPDELVISITKVDSNYKNKNKYAKKYGRYLYEVNFELLQQNNKPIIVLENMTANSSGDYVTKINLNEKLDKVNYKATSIDGDNLTDKVLIIIVFDDRVVDEVDTSHVGVYDISYIVVDKDGLSTKVTRSVIVSDLLAPELFFPEDTTISLSTTSYDLMDGVSCKDNSGNCSISFSGSIKFGVIGKYVIQYTAQDPSGNTITKGRVINVK